MKFFKGNIVKCCLGTNNLKYGKIYTILDTSSDGRTYKVNNDSHHYYDASRFELVMPETQVLGVPGVPEGYRLVRIGVPKDGELIVASGEKVSVAKCLMSAYAIVEKIVPDPPKTRSVVLNKYIYWDSEGLERITYCTEAYVKRFFSKYFLIEKGEAIEVPV